MGKRFDIDLELHGKDTGAGSAVDGLAQKLRALRKEERASGESALKGLFKGGDTAEGLASVFGGAEAGLGLFFIDEGAKKLGEFSDKLGDIKKQYQEGKLDAGGMVDAIAGSIPVLGEVWNAGRKIHGIFSSETEELAKQTEQVKRENEVFDDVAKSLVRAKEIVVETTEEVKKLNQQLAELNAPKDMRGIVAAKDAAENAVDALNKKYEVNAGIKTEKGGEGPLTVAERELKNSRDEQSRLAAQLADAKKAHQSLDPTDEFDQEGIDDIKAKQAALDAQTQSVSELARKTQGLRAVEQKARAQRDAEMPGVEAVGQKQVLNAVEAGMRERHILENQNTDALLAAKAELAAKQAEADNDQLKAELIRLDEGYRQKIDQAKSAAEQIALVQQRGLDEDATKKQFHDEKQQKAIDAFNEQQRAENEYAKKQRSDLEDDARGAIDRKKDQMQLTLEAMEASDRPNRDPGWDQVSDRYQGRAMLQRDADQDKRDAIQEDIRRLNYANAALHQAGNATLQAILQKFGNPGSGIGPGARAGIPVRP